MALRFDATADNATRTSDVLSYNANFCWMTWIQQQVDNNGFGIVLQIKNTAGTQNDAILLASDGQGMDINVNGAGTSSGQSLSVGTWRHVCMNRTATNSLQIYVDGVLRATRTTEVGTSRTLNEMEFGSLDGSNYAVNGRYAAMKAWSTNLTAEEIANEMRTIRPQRTANLYAWWPMVHNAVADSAKDFSGAGRDWTTAGTLTIEDGPPVSWGAGPIILPFVSTSHATTGELSSDAATISGSATHLTLHTTSGALEAAASAISGTAAHEHAASGALASDAATVAGAATHLTLHTTTGALDAQAATISGTAADEHAATGALAADAAAIGGEATHTAAGVHDATGALSAQDAQLAASAILQAIRRRRGVARSYIIKGRRYLLTNEELVRLLAQDLIDLTREDIKVTYKHKKPHKISKSSWEDLQSALKSLESVQIPEETTDDDEELLLLL